jgi:hypothetical protein
METLFRFDRFVPYGIPPLLTAIVCLFLASITFRAGRTKRENLAFTVYCLLQMILNLEITILTLLASESHALILSRLTHLVFVFVIPVAVTFAHEAAGIHHRKWLERGLYFFALIMIPVTQSKFYHLGMYDYFFGFYSKAGPAFRLFGAVGTAVTIYILIILFNRARRPLNPEHRLKMRFLLYGFFVSCVLTVGNVLPLLGLKIYPPGNFGFFPMGLMAYGVLRHQLLDTTKSWFSEGYISKFLAYIVWSPLVISLLFWLLSAEGTFYPDLSDRIFPYAIPPILSFLICFGLATISFLKGSRRTETLLFGMICVLWGILNLDKTLEALVTDGMMALKIARIDHFFLVLQLGIYAHFLHYFVNFPKKAVYIFYTISLLLMPITQTDWYYQGVYQFYWGYSAQKNIGFTVFGAITMMMIIWSSVLLVKAARKEKDPTQRSKYIFFLMGGIFTGLLNLGNTPSLSGREFYPPGNFTFIPILIMAYGVFRHDLIKINPYAKRRILDIAVKITVSAGFAALIPVYVWAVGDLDWEHIISRISSYGIPPLFTLVCSVFL